MTVYTDIFAGEGSALSDKLDWTGLLERAGMGDTGIYSDLMCGANPDARDKNGRTPLMRIANGLKTRTNSFGREVDNRDRLFEAAKVLFRYDPDLEARDNEGLTARTIAMKNFFPDFARMLDERRWAG